MRPFKAGWAAGAAAAVVALVVAGMLAAGFRPMWENAAPATLLRKAAGWVRGYAAWRQRAATKLESPPFGALAASQVGYGPLMVKQFSSPRRFASFQVVSTSGEVALQGGPPVREIPTDALGAVRTVWVGDFTPLQALGRYRIVADNGMSSYPFNVGPDVFDAAVRAVQRAFYYQRAFTAIDAEHAEGPWVHASDAGLAPASVVKGGTTPAISRSTAPQPTPRSSGCSRLSRISRPRTTTPASPSPGMACPT